MGDTNMQGFLFHGKAVALSGSVQKPRYYHLGEHAMVKFHAGSGGRAVSQIDDFKIDGVISYQSARSEAIATTIDGIYSSIVTTTIEGLNVFGRLTVDRIVSRLQSVYLRRDYPHRYNPRILPGGSTIEGLKMDGKLQTLHLPDSFKHDHAREKDFLEGKSKYDTTPDRIPAPLHFDEFGTVHYGEWTWVGPVEEEQNLTMLRLGLGSQAGGNIQVCMSQSNGVGWPRVTF
jgi:hypothetical protein